MNAVGIDVSKGKSTVAILRPGGEVVASPFEVSHNPRKLNELVSLIKSLNGDSKILMEYTGNYYLPVALFLQKSGLFVSVVNPILVKDYNNKSLSVRKGKTDKKDSLKLAAFALDRWHDLLLFSPQSDSRTLLKAFNRQYNQYNKLKVMLKNNLISVLDQTFPGANTLFSTPARKQTGMKNGLILSSNSHITNACQRNLSPLSPKAIFPGAENSAIFSPKQKPKKFMPLPVTALPL